MKKLLFLVIALLAIVSLAGCGGSKNGSTDNKTNGDGGGNGTDTAQWAAYAFGDTVKPSTGASGKVKSFTIDSVYTEQGKVREFTVEGTYLGTETVQITSQKTVITTSPYGSTTENVSVSLECYKVKHHVTVVKDETGENHPDWAEVTVWIPTGSLESTTTYISIYPKATYEDSNGHKGDWSYYLTDAMLNEISNPPAGTIVTYAPVEVGDFYGYDDWTFYGLYGWGWYWFKGFAEGGQQQLKAASWSYGGCSFTCAKGSKTISSYSFSAWTLDASCTYQGGSSGYKGVFSPDLPLPIYMKVGSTGDGTSKYWENTLTALQLQ
jgi:hypothetical protein